MLNISDNILCVRMVIPDASGHKYRKVINKPSGILPTWV